MRDRSVFVQLVSGYLFNYFALMIVEFEGEEHVAARCPYFPDLPATPDEIDKRGYAAALAAAVAHIQAKTSQPDPRRAGAVVYPNHVMTWLRLVVKEQVEKMVPSYAPVLTGHLLNRGLGFTD